MEQSQNDKFFKPKVEADKDENEKVAVTSQDHPSTSVDPAAKDPATPKPSVTKKRKLEVISDPQMNSEVKMEFKENEKVIVPSQDHPSTSVDPAAKDPATPKPSGTKKRKLEVISDPQMNSEVKTEFKEELSEVTMQEKEAIVNETVALRKENDRLKLHIDQYIQQSKIGMQEFDLLPPDFY